MTLSKDGKTLIKGDNVEHFVIPDGKIFKKEKGD